MVLNPYDQRMLVRPQEEEGDDRLRSLQGRYTPGQTQVQGAAPQAQTFQATSQPAQQAQPQAQQRQQPTAQAQTTSAPPGQTPQQAPLQAMPQVPQVPGLTSPATTAIIGPIPQTEQSRPYPVDPSSMAAQPNLAQFNPSEPYPVADPMTASPATAQLFSTTGLPDTTGVNWYDRLWELTTTQPQFGSVDPSMGDAALAAQQAAAAQRAAAAQQLGQYADIGGRSADEMAFRDMLLAAAGGTSPTYQYGTVDPTLDPALAAARDDVLARAGQMPQDLSYDAIDPVNNVAALDDRLQQFALAGLDAPSRYDTDLFNQLLESAMQRLQQEQAADELRLTRQSNRLLGPNSGQLKNEFIDLADAFDQNRANVALQLLREAATTQAQDRLAAADIASRAASDIFGRGSSLRDESRYERQFGRETDLLNRDAQERALERLAAITGQRFAEDQSLRNEARGEREFQFTTDRATEADRLANLMAQAGIQGQIFGQDQSVRNEQRADRDFSFNRDLANRDIAARAAQMEQAAAESNFGMDQSLRGEQRAERDFQTQDRLRQLGELQDFAALDRQLGRDAVDDYFRQFEAELRGNEALARLAQADFANNIALAQLLASLPATGDPGVDQAPGTSPAQDPMYWEFGQGRQTLRDIEQQYLSRDINIQQAYQALAQSGAPDSVIQEMLSRLQQLDAIRRAQQGLFR